MPSSFGGASDTHITPADHKKSPPFCFWHFYDILILMFGERLINKSDNGNVFNYTQTIGLIF